MLSPRLRECAGLVAGEKVCDVGADHAYLLSYLLKSEKCRYGIAADINDGPLAAARATLAASGVSEERYAVIKSDGLDRITECGASTDNPDGGGLVTDVVIAGMGGELISEIISECRWIKDNKTNLILQPMTRVHSLHRFLYESGFHIKKETAVSEGRFLYIALSAVFSGEPVIPDTARLYLGGLDMSDKNAVLYAEKISQTIYKNGLTLIKSGAKEEGLKMTAAASDICRYAGIVIRPYFY